jgi:hypothetical protein
LQVIILQLFPLPFADLSTSQSFLPTRILPLVSLEFGLVPEIWHIYIDLE